MDKDKRRKLVKRTIFVLIFIFLLFVTAYSGLAECNETQIYVYDNVTASPPTNGNVSILENITIMQTCTADEVSFIPIIGVVIFITLIFFFLAWLTDILYAKLILIIIGLGMAILSYSIGMEMTNQMNIVTLSNLLSAGYPVVLYSSLVIMILIVLYLFYVFIMGIKERVVNGKRKTK